MKRSRNLLYNIFPTVNSTVLCILKYVKRVGPLLNPPNRHTWPKKGDTGKFGKYCLIVAMVLQVFAYVQTYQIVPTKYMQFFVYQLHLNKAIKFKKYFGN